jgi:hypothetical protein
VILVVQQDASVSFDEDISRTNNANDPRRKRRRPAEDTVIAINRMAGHVGVAGHRLAWLRFRKSAKRRGRASQKALVLFSCEDLYQNFSFFGG